MKRIVWIAAAILVMICILGYGLHTLNKIDEVNKKRREKQAGEVLASQIIMTTATESIWDRLRATTEASCSSFGGTKKGIFFIAIGFKSH